VSRKNRWEYRVSKDSDRHKKQTSMLFSFAPSYRFELSIKDIQSYKALFIVLSL
jgi:hypothetical protein